jgi:Copper amine oxidase N-terminal domain
MRNLLRVTLAFSLAVLPVLAAAQSVTVIVNGQHMNFTQPPIERAGRVFVPLRGVFEQLGASVVYSNGQINATGNGRTISLTIGSTQATVGGQPTTMDVAPFIVGATTYVPLRFISQALGASVNWDDSTSTVTINGGRGGAPVPPPPPRPVPPPPGRPVRLVSVAPTGTIYTSTPTIRFQFDRRAQLSQFRISVDGRNVSSGVTQTGPAAFSFALPWRLQRGPHTVRVRGTISSGAPFDLNWSFVRG